MLYNEFGVCLHLLWRDALPQKFKQTKWQAVYWARADPEGDIGDCMLPLERNKDGYATFGHVGRHCFPKRRDEKKLKGKFLTVLSS